MGLHKRAQNWACRETVELWKQLQLPSCFEGFANLPGNFQIYPGFLGGFFIHFPPKKSWIIFGMPKKNWLWQIQKHTPMWDFLELSEWVVGTITKWLPWGWGKLQMLGASHASILWSERLFMDGCFLQAQKECLLDFSVAPLFQWDSRNIG